MRRVLLAFCLAGVGASSCFVGPNELCTEPGLGCPAAGRDGGAGDGGVGGGRAGGSAGGGGAFAGGFVTAGGSAGGFITAGGRGGGFVTAGGRGGGSVTGGGFGGGFVTGGGIAGGFVKAGGGGSIGGGGAFAGGFGGGGGAFAGGFGGGGAFAGGFGGGGGAFAGGFGGGGGAFAGGFGGGGGAFAGGFGGGFVVAGGGAFAGGFVMAGGFAGGSAGGPGESCQSPIVLTVPSTVMGTTIGAVGNHEFNPQGGTGCRRTGPNTPDVVYAFVVPPGRTLSAVVTPNPGFDAVINLVGDPSSCGAPGNPNRVCLAGADDPERVSYTNTSMVAVATYLVVSGFTSTGQGNFTLSVSFIEGDRCESAVSIMPGSLNNEPLGTYADDYRGAGINCASRSLGPDRVYRVTVPAQTALGVQVAPQGLDTSISFATAAPLCSPRQCTGAAGDTVGVGAIDRATFNNAGNTPTEVLIIVDSAVAQSSVTGTFSMTTTLGPISIVGDTCASAVNLSAGTFLPNETLLGYSDDFSSGVGCDYRVGPDRVYSIDVPGFTQLSARVSPTVMGFDPTISAIVGGCGLGFACSGVVSIGGGRLLTVNNPFTTVTRVYLVIDGISSGASTFSLGTALSSIPFDGGTPVDAGVADAGSTLGETCSQPDFISFGVPMNVPLGSSFNDVSGMSLSCQYGVGPDRMYRLTIGANQRLTVVATPQGPIDVALSLAADSMSCLSGSCLTAINTSTAGGTETLTFDNALPTPRQVTVIVDALTLASGNVTLFSTLSNINTVAETCLNALPITASQTLNAQTTAGFVKDYNLMAPGCVSPLGPETVYAVSLAANQTLTVTMTSMDDAAINIVAGPAAACSTAMSCLASADTGATGPETAVFTNGPTPQVVYVMLARWGGNVGSLIYDVSFTLTP